jgi:dTDP-4-dehydrorhamnose reductase
VVVNCIGLVKQIAAAKDPLLSIYINALYPYSLAQICQSAGSRLIHISNDCVFDGKKGNYIEKDASNADDLYGRTKYLGEVSYPTHCVTLRTSIIGHELKRKQGLLEWFLSQEKSVKGYTKAIYSGFPTVEMAKIICDFVIPQKNLNGIYHISSEPISKYKLLKMIAEKYGKKINIEADDKFVCDRSLDSTLFRKKTGYIPPPWLELVDNMYKHYSESKIY